MYLSLDRYNAPSFDATTVASRDASGSETCGRKATIRAAASLLTPSEHR